MSFFSYNLAFHEVIIFYAAALLVGMAKTGVQGAGMLAVPIVASLFGGIASTGVLLPILCMADAFAIMYYHRHASWERLKNLFPTTAIGTIIGVILGSQISDKTFTVIMAVSIVVSIAVMLWLEKSNRKSVSSSSSFSAFVGLVAGFASMVGNLAGPLMAVYFLSMRRSKHTFIGTAAWFFLVINLFKIPFHVFVWNTVSTETFIMDLTTLPVILAGAFLGIWIVKKFSEESYRWFIIVTTLIAAALMLF